MELSKNWKILMSTLIVSLGGSFHYGYQLSVINPSEKSFLNFLNDSFADHFGTYLDEYRFSYLWPSLVNIQSIGNLIGTFLVYFLENLGRKRSIYLTGCVFLISFILQSVSKSINVWEILLIGRFLCGIGQGAQMGVQPVYFAEISRKSTRGLIGSFTGFTVELGFLLASIIALPAILGDRYDWPYLFAIEAVSSVILLIALPFMVESPKFLASKGDFKAVEAALIFLNRSQTEARQEIMEIRNELRRDESERDSMTLKVRSSKVNRLTFEPKLDPTQIQPKPTRLKLNPNPT